MSAPPRLPAAIDIGTNSALLLVAAPGEGPGGSLRPVLQKIAAPRVGRNLAATGRISDASFGALQEALAGFLEDVRAAGARLVGAVATEAFRRAANGPALLAQVSARLGVPCRILAGEEEARLGWLAVADRHPLPGLAVIDIGAGSTEVTRREGGVSLPVGAVTLLEAWRSGEAGSRSAEGGTTGTEAAGNGHAVGTVLGDRGLSAACRERALAAFRAGLPVPAAATEPVCVGGAASALAMLKLGLRRFDADAIEGLRIRADEVGETIARLEALPAAERAALPGLDPGRAEIIVPGLCILDAYLRHAGCEAFRVSDRGIRYGVILDALAAEAGG